jgi:hypothetical protein
LRLAVTWAPVYSHHDGVLSAATTIDRALSLLLEDLARKKLAATERPRPSRGTVPGSRHVPAEVKRVVWARDGARWPKEPNSS